MTIVTRETKETRIQISIDLARDAKSPATSIVTGEPFLDHMLTTFARYAALDLNITAAGDLRHHLIEDVGIALGQSIALLAPAGAARYGERTIPMDDALVQVTASCRVGCTITGCDHSRRTRARRCTSACCAVTIATTSSRPRSRRSGFRCGKRWWTPAAC
jgi:imidazoleglycerol phosphate dehydratase HisB